MLKFIIIFFFFLIINLMFDYVTFVKEYKHFIYLRRNVRTLIH